MFDRLSNILQNNELHVTKCEPWNSVKVTFNLPKDAAEKLSKLAEGGDDVLRELGILSLQMEGGEIVSMTIAEESDGEDSSKSNPAVCKPNISPPKEEKSIKQEPDAAPQSPAFSGRPPGQSSYGGLAFPLLQASQQSSASRESIASAAALLLKNHSSSPSSSEQQSVLQSYNEGLLASLIQSNSKAASVSSLLGHLKDNGEPVNKKPRKSETESSSPKAASSEAGGATNFPYKGATVTTGPGFSLVPVPASAACTTTSSRSVTGSQSNSSPDNSPRSPLPTRSSPSALRIASLPGVSLTAVSSSAAPRNTQPPSHSQKLSKASLMPPPGVTLCPVPRTTATVSPSPPELHGIETGDISSPKSLVPSDNISSAPRPPLLINPVTGQFEAGAGSEAEQENNKNPDPDDAMEEHDAMEEDDEQKLLLRNKHKSGSQSPGISTSEPSSSLKVKLKVNSIAPPSNNSSKNPIPPKNDVMLKTTSNSSATSKSVEEPKVPKIKIRLGKDKNAVKLNSNDLVENHDGKDLDDTFSHADKSHSSPLQNDIKIKIKPLGGSPTDEGKDSLVNNITSPHFPNLANSIVNHTSIDDRKKKKDKMKDRLAVWTESLAKHGQREESKEKEEKTKETKSWPEVLEARLYGSGTSTGVLSFSKPETVLENQIDKGEPESEAVGDRGGRELTEEEDEEEEGSTTAHLNYRGPGQELPGPGLLALPASPQHSPDPADQHLEASQGPPETCQPSSLNAVLDILEGRPSLGEPLSPDCAQQSQDQAGQQGEDSGIESMDSRSEKSPNQGESPFHASSECGVELGRTPTYSSSMGPSSGKLSPPVSDPGSDSSPPDKSPSATSSTQPVQLANTETSMLTHSSSDSVNGKTNFLEESHKVTIPPNHSEDPQFNEKSSGENHVNPINSKIEIISSNGTPPGPSSEVSEKASHPFVNHQENSEQPKTENGGSSFENNKNDLESKSEDLLRSCDGADDLKILPTPKETPEITNCMHDYIFKDPEETSSESVSSAGPDTMKTLLSSNPISVSVRPALHVPPGARMVPVKLVTVPGAGNVRMLRVSPVKSGIITAVDGKMPGGLPPRTVVIKSSVLRTVSSQELGPASLSATPSVVSFPGQPVNCDIAGGPGDTTSQTVQSSIVTFSQLKKSHQVSLTPVENTTPSSFSSDSTKAASVTFQKRVSLEEVSSSDTPLSVDVSNRLTDAEQMPSPAQKAAQKFQHQKQNGEESVDSTLPVSPKPERVKGKKSNSGDLLKNDNSEGESLLRPLLAKEEVDQATILQPSSPLPNLDSPSALTLPLVNPRKRTRRDTGSSVNSDRSDQSQGEGTGKKSKATSPARRKSQADSTDSEEKQKSIKCKSDQSNGISEEASSSKKTIKSGERTKGRPTSTLKNSTNINNKVELKKSSANKAGLVKKVGRPKLDEHLNNSEKGTIKTDHSGRRVSTRSKKPDEPVPGGNKRR